jgi:hypothetical protein
VTRKSRSQPAGSAVGGVSFVAYDLLHLKTENGVDTNGRQACKGSGVKDPTATSSPHTAT